MPTPSKYRKEFPEQARKVCLLGATNEDLGEFFDVTRQTIDNWIAGKPEFAEAVREGKKVADARVAEALFHRALGYSHPEEKIFCHEGEIVRAETVKQYPPDATSMIFWLKNRAGWRDRQELAHSFDVVEVGPDEVVEPPKDPDGEPDDDA